MKRGVVIGAGIAGLAVATRLRKLGYRVDVFEKNDGPGGKIALIEQDGFRWDAGPSFFTDKKEFARLFTDSGASSESYVRLRELEEACRYLYEDGRVLYGYDSAARLAKEFTRVFNEPSERVKEYLTTAERVYRSSGRLFLDKPFGVRSFMSADAFRAVRRLPLSVVTSRLYRYNSEQFQTKEAADFFDRFATYNGSDPKRMPALFSCLPHLEHNLGAYYVDGGMRRVAEAAAELAADRGVRMHYGREIQKITYRRHRVTGVITDSGWVKADIVVSAADIGWVYRNLIHPHPAIMKYLDREPSASAVVFCWGINKRFNNLSLHNVFFSEDYTRHNKQIWHEHRPPDDPTVYVNITSKMNRSHAPKGAENWFVMINVPAERNSQEWIPKIREAVLDKLSRMLGEPIEQLIISERAYGPDHFETAYHANQGSLYGAASNSWRGAFFRHPNRSPEFGNLYFCGVTVHPGGGIPLALRSARIVAELVRRHER